MSTEKAKTTKANIYLDDYDYIRTLSFKVSGEEGKRVTIPDILQRIIKDYEQRTETKAN